MASHLTVPCPCCGSRTQTLTAVWDSYYKSVRRWRACQECDYRWATIEMDHDQAHLITSGPRRPQESTELKDEQRDL